MLKMIMMMLALGSPLALADHHLVAACSDVEFNQDLRDRFPAINEACLEIIEFHGNQYVKMTGRVVRASSRYISVKWKRLDGTYIDEVFRSNPLPSDFRVRLSGQEVRASELQRRQEINVYVQLGGETATLFAGPETAIEDTFEVAGIDFDAAPAMPTTASLIPAMGLLGGLAVLIGLVIRVVRRKLILRTS